MVDGGGGGESVNTTEWQNKDPISQSTLLFIKPHFSWSTFLQLDKPKFIFSLTC